MRALFWGIFGYARTYRVMVRNGERLTVNAWYDRQDRVTRQRYNHLIFWLESQGFKDEKGI